MGSIDTPQRLGEHLQPRPSISKAGSDTSIFAIPSTPTLQEFAKLTCADQAFENTSTSVAASQMRNALNNLADTVTDPDEKKVCSEPATNVEALRSYSTSFSRPRWTISLLFSEDT